MSRRRKDEGDMEAAVKPDAEDIKPEGATGKGWRKDFHNILLLLLLYTLQGVPMGLSPAIRLVFAERNVDYRLQTLFTLVSWPFSLKMLWAPLVDSCYVKSFGRRKSWLVPTQLLIAATMLGLGLCINTWLPVSKDEPPDVQRLTYIFFFLYFLCATQVGTVANCNCD
jgi:PAT family acetyl-CoA transporter-like MFS transporter 1